MEQKLNQWEDTKTKERLKKEKDKMLYDRRMKNQLANFINRKVDVICKLLKFNIVVIFKELVANVEYA